MNEFLNTFNFSQYVSLLVFLIVLYVADRVAVKFISRFIEQALKRINYTFGEDVVKYTIIRRLAHLVPAVIVNILIPSFQNIGFSTNLVDIIQKSTSIYIIIIITSVVVAVLNAIQGIYKKFRISSKLPIKNYIQIIKIVTIGMSIILIISVILGKSPLTWLTSFGAIAAIFSLAFKDSVADIVAGIEIAVFDVVRVGDWITISKFGIDGDVTDITLTRVVIQNFDKTVSFISTNEVLNSGIKNWRGMQDAGGRRIKRSFNVDMHDIQTLSVADVENINNELRHGLNAFTTIINNVIDSQEALTNEMLYRRYIYAYLKSHSKIHQNFSLIVRQLEPSENGLPIQIYCFTSDTNWTNYENIQSDIFSHLLAVLSVFRLKTYQRSSDYKK
jgi:miniconductance mechanosensitive channel